MHDGILHKQRGTSLIEVLVAMIILAVGLLSLVAMQSRLQVLQMESYQRSQALVLLHDMSSRIALNRNNAASYVTASPLGAGMICPTSTATRYAADASDWCRGLQGAAEVAVGGANVGAMIGARGCVESVGAGEYFVTVAWQGLAPISAPSAGVTCGAGLYNGAAGTPCINDLCRRVVTTVVRIATLT